MLRTGWHPGPATASSALVVVTDFRVARRRDLLAVARAGHALATHWPDLPGTVGTWLWTLPLSGRSGSVSVWESEEALKSFVRWPPHVEIMRRFRGAGTLRSHRWWTDSFSRNQTWRQARDHLRS